MLLPPGRSRCIAHPGDPYFWGSPLPLNFGKAEWPDRPLFSWVRRHSSGTSRVNDTSFGDEQLPDASHRE
jgi:hypothetical protein